MQTKKNNPASFFTLLALFYLTFGHTFPGTSYADEMQDALPAAQSFPEKWQQTAIDTTANADYLNDLEREIIIEINRVRTDPAGYARMYLAPTRQYYNGQRFTYPGRPVLHTKEGVRALDECVKVLLKTKPVHALSPKKGLTLAARDHAADQSRTGSTGHTGSDYSTMGIRMNRYGTWNISAAENLFYGHWRARWIVTSLLLDDGVASRGHRKNILNPAFKFIGVAVGPHPVYKKMCVMDFAGAYN